MPELKEYFDKYHLSGSIVIYNMNDDQYIRYNPERCRQGFLPASTFKIFNSLAGLESGVIKDKNYTMEWDGKDHGSPFWNKDQSLETAFKYSAVWYFQELARRVGPVKMKYFLDGTGYGNGDISAGIDIFWLEGNFRVSQDEQIEFMKKFYNCRLPVFSRKNIDIVKSLMLQESSDRYKLYAKTGTVSRVAPFMGLWVGFIENAGNVYFFDINVQDDNFDKNRDGNFYDHIAGPRILLTKEIMKYLGIYPGNITFQKNR